MSKILSHPEVMLFLAALGAVLIVKAVLYNVPATEPLF